MKQLEIVIQNRTGLHARPAKVLVNLAKQYKANISIQCGGKKANAKSMVSILTLGAVSGSLITLQVDGEDEDRAIYELEAAIKAGLGDEEPAAEPAVAQAVAEPAETKVAAPVVSIPKAAVMPSTTPVAPGVLKGVSAAPGIAVGSVFHFRQVELDIDSYDALPGDGKMSLSDAIVRAKEQLKELYQQMVDKKLGLEAAIFEAHSEVLDDPELSEAVQEKIVSGMSPAKAWKAVTDERAAMLAALPDPILSARSADLRDVGRRVINLMFGIDDAGTALPTVPSIVIATELSPSITASFNPEFVLGFAITTGGPTSHIAILARALGLPAVVGAEESILYLPDKTPVILDGNDGTLTANPDPDVLERAALVQKRWLEYRRLAQSQAALPAVTQDGHRVEVTANAGSVADAAEAMKMGADGIGLLRTEFLFLERNTGPTEEEQFNVYRAIAETMNNLPVIVRTLDIGGDKPVPYIQLKPELNPFLGERGIRLCLNRPGLFKEQLRAILRAAPHGSLRIMFPMVSDIAEVRQARALVNEVANELNLPPVPFGIMVEVPSAALLAEIIAPEIDFFSLGTNDLTQYTLAIDRGHPALATKHDGLHPAVLRLIAMTIDAAHKYGKRADICGELGSDSAAVPVLVGLGIDELSVSIPAIATVKARVRTLNFADLIPLASQALACSTPQEVRELVKKHFPN